MTRPRTIPDEALLDAALGVMRKAGPDGVTFASVAAASGLAAATLVQRFGSKRGLLRAALHRAWDLLDARTAALDAEALPTAAGAVTMLVELSRAYGAADDYGEGLLVLREDLRDPELRRRGVAWGRTLTGMLGRRLGTPHQPRPDLGRLMASQWQGCLLWWGFARDQPLADWVREELELWLAAAA